MRKIRLFIKQQNLHQGFAVKLSDNDFDYLTKVMRQKVGDHFYVFNGFDGEFVAQIKSIEKKNLIAEIGEKISDLEKSSNITLAFAPVKNVRIDFIAEKATELGVARFQPIITQHTIVDKINFDRFAANAKEACEQCERNDFPEIFAPKKLAKFLGEEEIKNKILILCDESGQGLKASEILPKIDHQQKEIVILVGPEGGFSEDEFSKMRALKNLFAISLGPRILRADTAIISALTLVSELIKK
jgi:16S rRNA (uracil1498-N3)-methyltransferase